MMQLLLAIIYLSFISLGLPDPLLGSAWPTMYPELGVPISYAGIVSVIISMGTVISSLQSDRLTKKFGAGMITAVSVAMTAIALFGFSISNSFLLLCLWAIPYGLGAGSVDAALNNFVALHFSSRHMSWLHCMWGVGTTFGPYVMGFALTHDYGWNIGYRFVSFLQIGLSLIIFLSLPLWKKSPSQYEAQSTKKQEEPLSLKKILGIKGAKEVMLTFFCYCALESTAMLWAGSYLTLYRGLSAQKAAGMAALLFIGITVGRAINGFLTIRFSDTTLIRMGECILAVGVVVLLLPFGIMTAYIGLLLIGLGCAPVYPCIIHSTPAHFGADKSQAIIGVQMASAYVGTCVMPPLFGFLAEHMNVMIYPFYLLIILIVMAWMHEQLIKKTA